MVSAEAVESASLPFEPIFTLDGTFTVMSNVALSDGLSQQGNQFLAPSGSQSVNTWPPEA